MSGRLYPYVEGYVSLWNFLRKVGFEIAIRRLDGGVSPKGHFHSVRVSQSNRDCPERFKF